ncbi:MAG: oxaloacetate decarboxylase [Alphaproteobacteria bacterium]
MLNAKRRNQLRAILSGQQCVTLATIFDSISARIAQDLDYPAGLMGGSIASYAVLGAPDLIVLTLTELAEQVRRCTRVSSVPLLVDADHGYGNALNVIRTIDEMAHAGAAATMIEDTLLPRAFGSSRRPQLLPLEEAVGKVKAAVEARKDSGLVVFGRTSAAAISGIDDAIARFKAYEAAGVDGLFLPGLRSRDELDRISAATTLPLAVGGAAEALCDKDYLASRRVRLLSAGHHTLSVAVKALYDAMKAVREGTLPARLPNIASEALMGRVTRAGDFEAWTKDFIGEP